MVWWSLRHSQVFIVTNTSSIIFSFIARLFSSIVYSLLRIFLHLFPSSSSSKFTPVNAKTSFCLNTIVASRRFKMIGWESCSSRHNQSVLDIWFVDTFNVLPIISIDLIPFVLIFIVVEIYSIDKRASVLFRTMKTNGISVCLCE